MVGMIPKNNSVYNLILHTVKGFSIQPHPTYSERSIDQQGVDYVGDTGDPYRRNIGLSRSGKGGRTFIFAVDWL